MRKLCIQNSLEGSHTRSFMPHLSIIINHEQMKQLGVHSTDLKSQEKIGPSRKLKGVVTSIF